jgi:hypothetical protein
MEEILKMCKSSNYADIELIVKTEAFNRTTRHMRKSGHRIRFGKEWMGKDAEIELVTNLFTKRPKVIIILIHKG